ncbi:MAG: hypothetical protein ACR2PS_18230, partial [Pseudomonadales bacterium]
LTTYMSVDATPFIIADAKQDGTGSDTFASIRKAIRQFPKPQEGDRLRVVVDYGTLKVDTNARRLVADIFRGMGHKAGYAGVDAHGHYSNKEGYTWQSLVRNEDDNPKDEQEVKAGAVNIYPVTTAFSHFLTKGTDCYIEVPGPVPLDQGSIFSTQELSMVDKVLRRLAFKNKKKVRLRVVLEEADALFQADELSQVKQDSDFHRKAVKLLKGEAFKQVEVDVQVGDSSFRSLYK